MLSAENSEYKRGQVEFYLVGRTELDAQVTAGADTLLLEQGRAYQRWVQHFARITAPRSMVS